MRKTPKPVAAKIPNTVAGMLDHLQDRQRAARGDIDAAMLELAKAVANLEAADAELVRTAELLGLPVEG